MLQQGAGPLWYETQWKDEPSLRPLRAARARSGLMATNSTGGKVPMHGCRCEGSTEDILRVTNLVNTERWARDTAQFDLMASCFNPEATVAVSWFKGTAADFITATRGSFARGTVSLHVMGGVGVMVKGERAVADSGAQIIVKGEVKGVLALSLTWARISERCSKIHEQWGIDKFNALYQTDTIMPYNPGDKITFDTVQLAAFRPSYAYLAYLLTAQGATVYNDLPGVDRPQTVADYYAGNQAWLNNA